MHNSRCGCGLYGSGLGLPEFREVRLLPTCPAWPREIFHEPPIGSLCVHRWLASQAASQILLLLLLIVIAIVIVIIIIVVDIMMILQSIVIIIILLLLIIVLVIMFSQAASQAARQPGSQPGCRPVQPEKLPGASLT